MKIYFRPTVYFKNQLQPYLWLSDGPDTGLFLTITNFKINVVKVPVQDGKYWVDREKLGSTKYRFDKAIIGFRKTGLPESNRAKRIIDRFLAEFRPLISPKPGKPRRGTPPINLLGNLTANSSNYPDQHSVSLPDICQSLGINPGKARQFLRSRINKPKSGWRWPTPEVDPIKELLREIK